jgi:hypothetical protein
MRKTASPILHEEGRWTELLQQLPAMLPMWFNTHWVCSR